MKTILLVGSSIFANWSDVAEIAPDDAVTNRAVGGTITAFWTEHLTTVLAACSAGRGVVLLWEQRHQPGRAGRNHLHECHTLPPACPWSIDEHNLRLF